MWLPYLVLALIFPTLGCMSVDSDSTARSSHMRPVQEVRYSMDAQIYIVRDSASRVQSYFETFPAEYVREAMNLLELRHVDSIPNTETTHTVVFALYDDVSPGAQITVTHQFQRYEEGRLVSLDPYRFEYSEPRTTRSEDPIVILNTSRAGGGGGFIIYSAYVDGDLAIERRMPISTQ